MKLHEHLFALGFVIIAALVIGVGPLFWATHAILKGWNDPATGIIIAAMAYITISVFRKIYRTVRKPELNTGWWRRGKKHVQEA